MAYIVADRVKETTTVTGTGPATLAGAASGYRSFASQLSIGDTCAYVIVNSNGSEWETGIGTYSAVNTLTRTTVQASTNANAAVVFTAGVKDVFMGPIASAVLDRNASVYELGSAKSDDTYVVITPPLPENPTREGASLYIEAGSSNNLEGIDAINGGDLVLSGGYPTGFIVSDYNAGKVIIEGRGGNLLQWQYGNDNVRGYIDYNGSFSLNPYATSAGSTNEIRFVELASNGTNYVGFKAPDSIASNRIWTLPNADGTVGNTLTTDGAGNLSWGVAGATQNVVVQVRNDTGATLTKGTVVYINNAIGQLPTVAKALATSDNTSAQTLGMISADLADNSNGLVTIIGLITGINTQAYEDGDQLYLSDSVAGTFTNVKPLAPSHLVYVGIVEYKNPSNGKIFVKVQNGYELDELHDVSAQSPSNGQTIVYNSANQLWEKNYPSLTNALSSVPVVSGAGNNLTFTAGSGVTSGAGGSLILQAGRQATTGGDGKVVVKQVAGQTSNLQEWQDSTAGIKAFVDSSGNIGTGLNANLNRLYIGPTPETYLTGGSQSVGIKNNNNGQLALYSGSVENIRYYTDQTWVRSNHSIVWSSSFNGATVVCSLLSEATNTLAQRNGTNAQTFRVYNTYTDASNYERLGITWASNICTIGLAQAGTGLVRSLVIAGANATSGAGGNVTITAGNGSGVGAGGNIILQPGAQGSSGGNGTIILKNVDGVEFGRFYKVSGGGFGITATGNRFDFPANTVAYGLGVSGGGFCRISANSTEVEMNAGSWQGNTRSIALPSGRGIGWSNSSTLSTYDLGMERATLGVLAITTNSSTTVGSSSGGSLSFPSSTTAFSANTNDLTLTASAFQRINCTSAASLTGIAPPSGGTHVDGRMVRVYNVGTANLTLAHNSASSTAANRMFSSTGADIILAPNDYAELIYDATSNGSGAAGWRVS